MSSAIKYKFRASKIFESLPMPGTSARLFDVKKAIVRAKKLDKSAGGAIEFDFSVKNAMTNEAYDDESMLLPRGSRLIVQRHPALKGHGLLSKIARDDAGISNGGHVAYGNTAAAQSGFYTIESHKGEQDEFVDARPTVVEPTETNQAGVGDDSEKELDALRAVTDNGGSMYSRPTQPGKFRSGGGGVPLPQMGQPNFKQHSNNFHSRPNADPELREQERHASNASQAPKIKRATGIPRTFLNLKPTPDADGAGDSEERNDGAACVSLLPNKRGFDDLARRGGGISESGVGGKKLDLDYALNLINKTIPDHLRCGICSQLVKNAMLITWDTEGRTACELCMRDGLAQNGFQCPLTGIEGVSPDDLFQNHGLRKAAEMFEEDVMKSMRAIVEQQEAVEEVEREVSAKDRGNDYEGDMDKGMIKRKNSVPEKKRRNSDDFGEDDFGGDIFDVSNDVVKTDDDTDMFGSNAVEDKAVAKYPTQNENKDLFANNSNKSSSESAHGSKKNVIDSGRVDKRTDNENTKDQSKITVKSSAPLLKKLDENPNDKPISSKHNPTDKPKEASKTKQPQPSTTVNRREMLKNRGPPAGYMMGPAGGATVHGSTVQLAPKSLSSSHTDTGSAGSIDGGRDRGHGSYHHDQGGRGEGVNRNAFDNQGIGGFHGRGRGRNGGRFNHGHKPSYAQQRDGGGGGGGGRGHRGGFGQSNYQNSDGRGGQQGWRGDNNGRGNHNGSNGDHLNNKDEQHQVHGKSTNNQYGQNRPFSQNGKRPRSGSGDHISIPGRHEHTNRGPSDDQARHFHNNWHQNSGQDGGRGRGFNQRVNDFDNRGRGDFHRGGPGRGAAYSQGKRGRSDFFRGRGGNRRGRF